MSPYIRRAALAAACLCAFARSAPAQTALLRGTTIEVELPGLSGVVAPETDKSTAPAGPAAPVLPEGRLEGRVYEDPRFTVEAPEGWSAPASLASGVRYLKPRTDASVSLSYYKYANGIYKDAEAYRAHMRAQGTISDSHILDTVEYAGRWASRARYDAVVYGRKKLFTDLKKVYTNEELLVPGSKGFHVIRYRAPAREFDKHRPDYLAFLRATTLSHDADYVPEDYYLKRAGEAADLFAPAGPVERVRAPGRRSYLATYFESGLRAEYSKLSPSSEGLSVRPKTGAGGTLYFFFYPADWLGIGPELAITSVLKEKRDPGLAGVEKIETTAASTLFSLAVKAYPAGKLSFAPYLLAGIGQHDTRFKLALTGTAAAGCVNASGANVCGGSLASSSKGPALSAAVGLEKRFGETWGMSLEARYRRLYLSGGGMTGTASSLSYGLASTWHFGRYHFADDVVHLRRGSARRSVRPAGRASVPLPGFDEGKPPPKNERFSHKVPLGWKGPVSVPGGHRYAAPGGDAAFSVVYVKKGSDGYLPPPEYRRELQNKGTISDSRALDTVRLGRRLGSRVRYTTHRYRERGLLGETLDSFYSEEIYLPDRLGHYRILYRARAADFDAHYPGYQAFLKSLELAEDPAYEAEEYYRLRDHILAPLLEEGVSADKRREIPRRILFDDRLQAGLMFNRPAGFGFQFMYAVYDKWSAGLYLGVARLGSGELKTKAIGGRARWHYKDSVTTGPYLFADLSYVSAPLPTLLHDQETVTESRSAVFHPTVGIGWLHLWDYFYADAGWGWGPEQTLKKSVVGTPPVTGSASVSRSVKGTLYLSGGFRF